MSNMKTPIGKIIGKSLNGYYEKVKPTIDDLKFRQKYQDRIIECMTGEVDDNYIETPETDAPVVKLEHSKDGLVKVSSVKGKTILVDADGNETDTPAEGCRLVSVGEQEDNKLIILSKNKNLFNKDDVSINTYQYCNGTNGNVASNNLYNTSGLIKVQHGKTYYFTGIASGLFYDINKKPIINKPIFNSVITPTEGIGYMNLNISKTTDLNTVIVEEGSRSTSYIEPKQHKTEILLDEPLRKYDYILNSRLYRKCKNIQIESDFKVYGHQIWNDYYGVYMGINGDFSEIAPNRISGETVYYSKFIINHNRWDIVADYGVQAMNMYMLSTNLSKFIQLFCKIPKNEVDLYAGTIDEKVQQWFNDNAPRLDIVYEIAEPIIEELPNSITLQGFDDTTMYIENSITPTVSYGYNALIPYKEELSNQKEEVEINTLDIENNIIPYLLDMEFNLMTMEDK